MFRLLPQSLFNVPAAGRGAALAVLVLMLPLAADAQTIGRLAGSVTDDNDRPLQGATVKVLGAAPAREITINRADGSYAIPGMRPGDYEIEFRAAGFEPQRKSVRIAADRTSILNTRLSPELPESVVGVPQTLEPLPKPDGQEKTVANINSGTSESPAASAPASPSIPPAVPPRPADEAAGPDAPKNDDGPRDSSATHVSGGILVNVIDEEGKPLGAARLFLGDSKRSLAALPDGSIGVEKVSPGDYDVTFTAKGFQPEKRTVRVVANRVVTLIVKLAAANTQR